MNIALPGRQFNPIARFAMILLLGILVMIFSSCGNSSSSQNGPLPAKSDNKMQRMIDKRKQLAELSIITESEYSRTELLHDFSYDSNGRIMSFTYSKEYPAADGSMIKSEERKKFEYVGDSIIISQNDMPTFYCVIKDGLASEIGEIKTTANIYKEILRMDFYPNIQNFVYENNRLKSFNSDWASPSKCILTWEGDNVINTSRFGGPNQEEVYSHDDFYYDNQANRSPWNDFTGMGLIPSPYESISLRNDVFYALAASGFFGDVFSTNMIKSVEHYPEGLKFADFQYEYDSDGYLSKKTMNVDCPNNKFTLEFSYIWE